MNATHLVHLRWTSAEEGGRRTGLPAGPEYRPTAHFEGEPLLEFSVGIEFPEHSARRDMTAGLRLLFPDNLPDVIQRLVPGARLEVMEGRRLVARAEVVRSLAE